MKVKEFLKSKGIDGYNLELSTEEKGWHSGDLKKLLKDYKKQLNLHDVSQQRELLFFGEWIFDQFYLNKDVPVADILENYLKLKK